MTRRADLTPAQLRAECRRLIFERDAALRDLRDLRAEHDQAERALHALHAERQVMRQKTAWDNAR